MKVEFSVAKEIKPEPVFATRKTKKGKNNSVYNKIFYGVATVLLIAIAMGAASNTPQNENITYEIYGPLDATKIKIAIDPVVDGKMSSLSIVSNLKELSFTKTVESYVSPTGGKIIRLVSKKPFASIDEFIVDESGDIIGGKSLYASALGKEVLTDRKEISPRYIQIVGACSFSRIEKMHIICYSSKKDLLSKTHGVKIYRLNYSVQPSNAGKQLWVKEK